MGDVVVFSRTSNPCSLYLFAAGWAPNKHPGLNQIPRFDSALLTFIMLFEKSSGNKIIVDTVFKNQQYVLKLHTQFIEIGFNRNFEKHVINCCLRD